MTTKELLKSKLEDIREDYLDILLRIMNSLESPGSRFKRSSRKVKMQENNWLDFIEDTYGCLVNDPIERAEQGSIGIRKSMK